MPNGHDWEIKDRLYEEINSLRAENKRLWRVEEHISKCVMCQNQGTEKCSEMGYIQSKMKERK
jgi:hypothetical protein